jgi:hypothetical protein
MNERIKHHVDHLFRDAPRKRRVAEIQEELLANLNDKYEDLIQQGKSEDEAFGIVASGVGDIGELIADVTEIDRREFARAVRGGIIGKKAYKKEDDSFVEEYKEKISKKDKNTRLLGAVSSALWTLTVVAYIIISFWTTAWHITWVIFLIGAVLQQAVQSIIAGKLHLGGMLWTSTTILYLILSFATMAWHVTWVVFLVAAAVQQLIRAFSIWREDS